MTKKKTTTMRIPAILVAPVEEGTAILVAPVDWVWVASFATVEEGAAILVAPVDWVLFAFFATVEKGGGASKLVAPVEEGAASIL
jgi:hypothetical protein